MTPDIRQSPNWAAYLKTIGWETFTPGPEKSKIIYTKYFGPLKLAKAQRLTHSKNEIQQIISACKAEGVFLLKMDLTASQKEIDYTKFGFIKSKKPTLPPKTILIDLTNTEQKLWENLSKSAKYGVNRAKREGFITKVIRAPSKNEVAEFYETIIGTLRTRDLVDYGLEDLLRKIEIFGENSFIAFSLNPEGEVMGANLYLGFEKGVWFLQGGTTDVGRKSKAGYLLYWDAFMYFKNLGFEFLDLEGAFDPRFPKFTSGWEGFTEFKMKFGGVEVEMPDPVFRFVHEGLNKIIASTPKAKYML